MNYDQVLDSAGDLSEDRLKREIKMARLQLEHGKYEGGTRTEIELKLSALERELSMPKVGEHPLHMLAKIGMKKREA